MDMRLITGKKRDGKEISKKEFEFFVSALMNNEVDEAEVSAFLMAVTLIGLSDEEAFFFSDALAKSGAVLGSGADFEKTAIVSKQSIGGISDIVSMIVIPVLTSLGIDIMKMGRIGEARTFSTLDRFSVFDGFDCRISSKLFFENLKNVGAGLAVLPKNVVPAEARLFSIRKKTGSYPSVPLLAVSVISRNIALGTKFLLFDIKCGDGSFIESVGTAEEISRFLLAVCKRAGIDAVCLISNLDQPLGGAVGKEIEVLEAIKFLKSDQKFFESDLYFVCREMCATVCLLLKAASSKEEAYKMFERTLFQGKALEKFKEIVETYGGNFSSFVNLKSSVFKLTKTLIKAEVSGFVYNVDSKAIFSAVAELEENSVGQDMKNKGVGVEIFVKEGEKVKAGQVLASLLCSLQNPAFSKGIKTVREAFHLTKNKTELRNVVFKVIC